MEEELALSARVLTEPSMVAQVMNEASSLTRKSTTEAISSGSPKRPSGQAAASLSLIACDTRAPMAVLITPGAMAFTRMPCRPSRVPRLRVRLMRAAFDAPYSIVGL